jgi:NitT/TauT family transport system substrate-binding protein
MSTKLRVVNMSGEVYYAPQMVALEAGYFRDEGLDVGIEIIPPAKLPFAISSGEADFALSGMWQAWLYNERLGTDLKVFAQVVQRPPLMLFGRVPAAEFDWASLSQSALIHTSVLACSPWCVMQAMLRVKGVDLSRMGLLIGFSPEEALRLFKPGLGDVVEIFAGLDGIPWLSERDAHQLVDWGADLGSVPWSVYFAKADRLKNLQAEAAAFSRAIGRAQQWLCEQTADEVSALLHTRYRGTERSALCQLIAMFQRNHQWPASALVQREGVERWRHILTDIGLLKPAPFDEIVVTGIAQ